MWGEVNSTVHRGLGVLGCVTNGSVRDLTVLAKGFPILAGKVGPSHAWVHVEGSGLPVDTFGLTVVHGDLIHADRHGAVVIPHELAAKLPAAIDLLARKEKVILDAARKQGLASTCCGGPSRPPRTSTSAKRTLSAGRGRARRSGRASVP